MSTEAPQTLTRAYSVVNPTSNFRHSLAGLESKTTKPQDNRKTKIVCTLGQTSQTVEMIIKLLHAGMNVARLNFSHGDHKFHALSIANVRKACEQTGITCAVLLDTKGPEIRTGLLKDDKPVNLIAGQSLDVICGVDDTFRGDNTVISMDFPKLAQTVKPGMIIKISDGLIVCKVEKVVGDNRITCIVQNSAELGQRKGVNLPGARAELPFISDRDKSDLLFGVEQNVDMIAASFTRSPQDVRDMRKVLGDKGKDIMIICKIENQEGLDNFDEILQEANGIMVARGDLGVEIPIQKVCLAQKMMIRKCNVAGKPIITATQMLESMILNPHPTRAEATDIANAVFDGTDCVMLSGETAKGNYPVEAVEFMSRICKTSELAVDYNSFLMNMITYSPEVNRAEAVASAAVKISLDLESPLLIVITETGTTARFVAKYKPAVPVLTLTWDPQTARQCMISRSLWPVLITKDDNSAVIKQALTLATANQWVHAGDEVVVVAGLNQGTGSTNTLQVLPVPK